MSEYAPLRAVDLLMGEPWAIAPEAMETILAIAQRINDSPEAVSARLGRPLQNARTATQRNGAALIPITGPIFRRANLFTEISGATSVEILARDIQAAIDDPAISRIVLELDSPGGQATGIAELAAMIRQSPKPITAYVDGMAASAAYWLAAAAGEIVLSSTSLVGSIGVIVSYRPEKDAPIKIISSQSPLKQADPATDQGRAEVQRLVDQLAEVFVADVAQMRGVTPEQVLADFGQGGLKVGAHAVAARMADRLGGFESLIAGVSGPIQREGIPMAENATQAPELTAELIAADHPAIYDQIHGEGKAAGQKDERERVSAILAHAKEGGKDPALAHAAISSGLTLEQSKTMLDAAPKASAANSFRADFLEEGKHAAPSAESQTGEPSDTGADPDAKAKQEWESSATLRAEFANDFERFQAFQRAQASGRVRILRK